MSGSAVQVVIAARPDEVVRVKQALDELVAAHRLPSSVMADMQVALDEILTNAIMHGGADDRPHEIRVRLSVSASALVAEIEDDGRPFDPLAVPPPDLGTSLHERRVGGLGIHFVRRLMSRVEYARLDNRNRLVLERTLVDRKEGASGAA